MKRLLLQAAILLLALTYSACGRAGTEPIYSVAPTTAVTTTAEPTAVPALPENSKLTVHYIDVGQADASLIVCDGSSMLIDGGNAADSNLIAAYLKKQSISTLDYVVCTHAHEDHVGGLSGALSVVDVKNVLAPNTKADTKAYRNFQNKTAEQGLTVQHPTAGDNFALGSSTVQIIGPVTESTSDLNNTSIVMKLNYGDTSFLFTGDAERDEEQDIINAGYDISADILKVGHHGSDSSTSYVWLREIMPEYAVISVGKGNAYGHPTETVLSRLRDADVKVYRTDLQGDIIAVSDGNTVAITTTKNEDINTNETVAEPTKSGYIGNKNSKKFHKPDCRTLPAEQNRVYFNSRDEAINAGFSSCSNCHP